jgi:hypothetical protein
MGGERTALGEAGTSLGLLHDIADK